MALILKVIIKDRCVFKKWPRWIVIGHYHVHIYNIKYRIIASSLAGYKTTEHITMSGTRSRKGTWGGPGPMSDKLEQKLNGWVRISTPP